MFEISNLPAGRQVNLGANFKDIVNSELNPYFEDTIADKLGYEELENKKKYKDLTRIPRKKDDLEVCVADFSNKAIIIREKNKEAKIDLSKNEYPIKQMDILPSGDIYVSIRYAKVRYETYIFNKEGKKIKKLFGEHYDWYHNKLTNHELSVVDYGVRVIKYVPKSR